MNKCEINQLKNEIQESINKFGIDDFPNDDVFNIDSWQEKLKTLPFDKYQLLLNDLKDFKLQDKSYGLLVIKDIIEYNEVLTDNEFTALYNQVLEEFPDTKHIEETQNKVISSMLKKVLNYKDKRLYRKESGLIQFYYKGQLYYFQKNKRVSHTNEVSYHYIFKFEGLEWDTSNHRFSESISEFDTAFTQLYESF